MSTAVSPQRHPYPEDTGARRALNVVGQKWMLPIIEELMHGPVRFVEIQRRLGISTEQLRTCCHRLVEAGLVTKTRYREVPPRVDYELTLRGASLVAVLQALAHWDATWNQG